MLNVTKMTRMQAERMVSATTDPETLKMLGDHKNKHVRTKVAYKMLFPEERIAATGAKHLSKAFQKIDTLTNKDAALMGEFWRGLAAISG